MRALRRLRSPSLVATRSRELILSYRNFSRSQRQGSAFAVRELGRGLRAGQLLADRDPHGNVQVSRIETEKLLIGTVTAKLAKWKAEGKSKAKFSANVERRHGKDKPVIRKALVELSGKPFKYFASQRDAWAKDDAYLFRAPFSSQIDQYE